MARKTIKKRPTDPSEDDHAPRVRSLRDALPGDLPYRAAVERMIRVDHAGEYGAVRIYEGQLAVLGKRDVGPVIAHMAEQEREHLATFGKLVVKYRTRPTVLLPLWHVAGFALGAGTAMLGEKAAMACTVAVEEVIDEHYGKQLDRLGEDEPELAETFKRFRQQEREHRETGLAHDAEGAPGYDVLKRLVKSGSRMAIWLSERV